MTTKALAAATTGIAGRRVERKAKADVPQTLREVRGVFVQM
jgi:hypothetical protein